MPLNLVGQLGLLGPAFIRLAAEEGLIDHPVELVIVHSVDTPLDLRVLSLEARYGLRVVATLVRMALVQCLLHPGENLFVELEPPERSRELLLQHLLTNVRLRALALVAGTVVIEVAPLFQFADETTAAMTTRDQSGKREIVLLFLAAAPQTLFYNLLHLLPQFPRNNWFVGAPVRLASKVEVACVNPVVQDFVYRRLWHGVPALTKNHPGRLGLFRYFC